MKRLISSLVVSLMLAAVVTGPGLAGQAQYLLEGMCFDNSNPDPELHQVLSFGAAGTMPEIRAELKDLRGICAKGTLLPDKNPNESFWYTITKD